MEVFLIFWIVGGDCFIYIMGFFNFFGFGFIFKLGLEFEKCFGVVLDRGRFELLDVLRVVVFVVDELLMFECFLGVGGFILFDCFNFDCIEIVFLVIDFLLLIDVGLFFKLILVVDFFIKVFFFGNCVLG